MCGKTEPIPAPSSRIGVAASEAILAAWDACFRDLWSASAITRHHAAQMLFGTDPPDSAWPEAVEQRTTLFEQTLLQGEETMPETAPDRYRAVVYAVWSLLQGVVKSPQSPASYQHLVVTLRPIRRLPIRGLASDVCEVLYDYYRGLWSALPAPHQYVIRRALASTLAAFAPVDLQPFWEGLQDTNPMRRGAMLLGLRFLRTAHAVSHLLYGLETSRDHAMRAAMVDCLEEIADPRAIASLTRLRQETAQSDWTLSRQIARALRVIEQQNRGQLHRTLLRPADMPEEDEQNLLRPATDRQRAEETDATLLRPTSLPEDTHG